MESFDEGARLKEPSITLNLDAKEYYKISLVDYQRLNISELSILSRTDHAVQTEDTLVPETLCTFMQINTCQSEGQAPHA